VDQLKEVAEAAVAGLLDDEEDLYSPRNSPNSSPTSVMLRNIPNKYTRGGLITALMDQGFDACKFCNNLYLPMDAGSGCNLGFCFLNFHRYSDASEFMTKFEGIRLPSAGSRKVCSVVWANRQGVFQHSNPPGRVSDEASLPVTSASSDGSVEAVETPDVICHSGTFAGSLGPGTPCKVFVGGLSATTSEADLVNYFQQFGPVRECCIVTNRQTGTSRGFGFCEFAAVEAVHKVHAAQIKKPHCINGRVVSVRLYSFQQTGVTGMAAGGGGLDSHQSGSLFYVF
jgi:hypothetical protein